MRAIVLYRPNSEASRVVEEYTRDFEHYQRHSLELINLDTREGASIAALYDLVQNPSLIVLRDDGQLVKAWQGEKFPLMNELAGYLNA